MNTKHTPGPWYVCEDNQCAPRFWITQDRDTWHQRVCSVPDYGERSVFDARLIAAAPDLLEGAKQYLAQIDACGLPDDDVTSLFRAAIAKAEGQP